MGKKKDEIGDLDKLVEGLNAMNEGRYEDANRSWQQARDIQEKHEQGQQSDRKKK